MLNSKQADRRYPAPAEGGRSAAADPQGQAVVDLDRSGQQAYRLLSVLIPAFNEEHYIEQVLEEVLNAPLPEGMELEVVVVDDASTDRTGQVLERFARSHANLRLLSHSVNQGKGAALRSAIQQAKGDVIVIQDADLEYSPSDYEKLLKPILNGDADVVYGSRFLSSDYRRVLYFWHSLGNRFLTAFSNCFTNLNLTDMETCFKMTRACILQSIPIRSNRFGVEPELTAKFAKRGCRIYEVPVSYRGRTYQEGKKITWWDGFKAIFTILYFSAVEDLYDEKYGHEVLHSLSKTQRFNGWLADTVRPWLGRDVLEIGAGIGNLTQRLMPRDSYMATDVDPLHLDYLRNFYSHNQRLTVVKLDVQQGEDFDGLEGRFDSVVCLNVLEHVERDDVALGNIFRSLRPGGAACILVPRGPRLQGTLDEALGHIRRYTAAELSDKMKRAGFEVEKQFTLNRVSVFAWWLNGKILRKKRFDKLQLKVFDSTVWLWRRVDRLFPWPGLSLIAIGRKPASAE